MTDELEQLLKNLRLKRIREIYDEQLRAAEKEDPSYTEFFLRLLRPQCRQQAEGDGLVQRQRQHAAWLLQGDLQRDGTCQISGSGRWHLQQPQSGQLSRHRDGNRSTDPWKTLLHIFQQCGRFGGITEGVKIGRPWFKMRLQQLILSSRSLDA